MKQQLTGWRCAVVKLALVPLFVMLGIMITLLVPLMFLAGLCALPFLPIYKTSGFGISLGEGEGE